MLKILWRLHSAIVLIWALRELLIWNTYMYFCITRIHNQVTLFNKISSAKSPLFYSYFVWTLENNVMLIVWRIHYCDTVIKVNFYHSVSLFGKSIFLAYKTVVTNFKGLHQKGWKLFERISARSESVPQHSSFCDYAQGKRLKVLWASSPFGEL